MNTDLILKQVAKDNKTILRNPSNILNTAKEFQHILMLYEGGIKQITTKFEILTDEFECNHERNPISSISSRVKDPMSIAENIIIGSSFSIKSMLPPFRYD